MLKLYPGRLRIEIKERKAFALWQKDGRVSLIAADGTVLEPYVPQRFAVAAAGGRRTAPSTRRRIFSICSSAIRRSRKSVEASVLVAERRWNLHLKSGVEVLLPEARARAAR